MSEFLVAAKLADVPDPGFKLCEVDEQFIVVFRAAGNLWAVDDECTHDGGTLADGLYDSEVGEIMCDRHGARFDVKTGAAKSMPAVRGVAVHEVKVDGEDVLVKLSE